MTKGFFGFGFSLIIFLSMMLSCTHTPEEILPPKDELCDSTDITYTETVFSILNENCISCHNEANPSGGINLSNYQNSKAAGAINSGNYGSLLGTIKWSGGNVPMPKNSNKLSDCHIKQIQKWIEDGMPEN